MKKFISGLAIGYVAGYFFGASSANNWWFKEVPDHPASIRESEAREKFKMGWKDIKVKFVNLRLSKKKSKQIRKQFEEIINNGL